MRGLQAILGALVVFGGVVVAAGSVERILPIPGLGLVRPLDCAALCGLEHPPLCLIVIGADPSAKENRVEAWISAHCHVSRAGSKQVCSEQLSFLLEGPCTSLLPNIVFSLASLALLRQAASV